MPTLTQERITAPIFVKSEHQDDRLTLKASTCFVSQSLGSIESKLGFLADRTLIEEAAEVNFGGRLLRNIAEASYQMRTRKALRAAYQGEVVKTKGGAALAKAIDETAQLAAGERQETEYLARYANVRKTGKAKRLDEGEIAVRAKELVRGFAVGEITDIEAVREASEQIGRELAEKLGKKFGNSKVIASDLADVALEARQVYDQHKERLEQVDFDLSVMIGSLDGGLQTKNKRELLDKLVEFSEKNRLSAIAINPVTVGVAVGAVSLATKAVSREFVPVIGGIAGGAFAAVRRYSKEGKDRFLKQREAEIGLDISQKAQHLGVLGKAVRGILGKTDFANYSYDLMPAFETGQKLREFVDSEEPVLSGEAVVELVAEVRARLDVAQEDGKATIVFGKDGDGLFNINKERFELASFAAMAFSKVCADVGEQKATELRDKFYAEKLGSIKGNIKAQDRAFVKNRTWQSARSFGFAAAMGILGGLGIYLAGEAGERVYERASDLADNHEFRADTLLGNGTKSGVVNVPTVDSRGLAIELPEGYSYDLKHGGTPFVLDGPDGHFELGIEQNMSAEQIREQLNLAGLDGKISLQEETVNLPGHSIQPEILSGEFLGSHNIAEITGKDWDLTFGQGRELTLRQITGTEWAIPEGDNFVAFYQLKDEAGNWHTMLADGPAGKFDMPSEFINPETGRLDAISAIGYGIVKDANDNVISADAVLANPELIEGGSLESLASIAIDQKERMIPGESYTLSTIQVEDLAKIGHVQNDYNIDVNLPPVVTAIAPRMFPEAARKIEQEQSAVLEKASRNGSTVSAMAQRDVKESREKADRISKTFLDWAKEKAQAKADQENESGQFRIIRTADKDRPVKTKRMLATLGKFMGSRPITEEDFDREMEKGNLELQTQSDLIGFLKSEFSSRFWKPVFSPFWARKREEEERRKTTIRRRLMGIDEEDEDEQYGG